MKEKYSFRLEKKLMDELIFLYPGKTKVQIVTESLLYFLNADQKTMAKNKTVYGLQRFEKKYDEALSENRKLQEQITNQTNRILELSKQVNHLIERLEESTNSLCKQSQEHYDSLDNTLNSGFKTSLNMIAKCLYHAQYANQSLYKDLLTRQELTPVSLTNELNNSHQLTIINQSVKEEMEKDRERRIQRQQL